MMSNDTVIASLKEKIDDLNHQAWEARVSDSQKAFQLSQESVKLARSINYSKGLAEGLRSLGFCYVRLFKNDEAMPLLRESLSLFQSLNDLKGQAIVYEYLGIIERNWGNLGASLELLLKGNELAHQTGPLEVEGTSCYQIGVTYKHLGNHDLALDYLYRSLSLSKEIGLRLMEAYAINIIGSIYFDNGNYTHALDCYQQGLVIRQQSHDKWGEAGSLDNIGFTYLKLNDLDKAIDYCKQSLEITQSTNDKKGEANTLLHLAEIYQQAGDIGQASEFSNQSLEIRKLRGDKRGEAEVLLFIAGLNKNSSDAEDRRIFEWISVALNIADEIKAQDLLSKAYLHLHEYYSRKGNFKESLVQLEAHLRIEKELHKNAINQKVQNLEISHKAEEIKKEAEAEKLRNKELTELNERIEKANEELKIEASLERVRTTAMAMKEPADMLQVCRIISDQLLQLGFNEIRNVQTVIIYPRKHEYLNYQYFTPYDKDSIETIDYRLHPDVLEFTNHMLSSPVAYYTKTFEGEELKTWREYRKKTNQLHDPRLDAATSSHYYFYSIGSGALGVTTYAPLSDGQINLFKRFRNVFELAYRRFIDIEKALAQAREAQIEAALERVRAVAMSMMKPEDLLNICEILFAELEALGFKELRNTIVNIYNEEKESFLSYDCFGQGQTAISSSFFNSHPASEKVTKQIRGTTDAFVEFFLTGEELEDWKKFRENNGEYTDAKLRVASELYYYFYSVGTGALGISTLKPVTADKLEVLKRFKNVFDLSYRRYSDIEKAQAQAREAQIEAALERVRAKSMAMHHSDDLITVINIVQEQLLGLGFHFHAANFVTDYSEKGYTMWLASPGESFPFKIYVPQVGLKYFEAVNKAIEKGLDFATYTLNFEEKNIYFKNLFESSLAKNTSEQAKRIVFESKGMAASVVLLDKVRLNLMNLDLIPFTDEENNILKRFGYVFEQSYTRFLDLQKAEAQAREAQIEAGLERVRSKTMAMHRSEEVTGVAVSLNEELLKLGFEGGSTIIIINRESGDTEQWTGFSADKSLKSCFVPYFKHPCHEALLAAWKKGEKFLVYTVAGNEKKLLDEHYFTTGYKDFPESDKRWMRQMESVTFSHAFMKYGAIHWGPDHLTEEQMRILQRFSTVFEQSYTRFLDLQKAEAQTKEAQREVALERIRARAMAMHSSTELIEVAQILREQMGFLDQPDLETSVVNLFDEDSEYIHSWHAFREPGASSGQMVNGTVSFRKDSSGLTREMIDHYHSGKKEYTLEATGEKLNEFVQVLINAEPGIANYIGKNPPEKVYYHFATFRGGALLTVSYQPTTEDVKALQRRAASVFEMAYRRYLDLKKAEAQTREAQIEIAVERVRAKALAMHRSEEILGVVATLRNELLGLNIPGVSGTTIYLKQDDGQVRMWDLTSVIELEDGFHLTLDIVFPLEKTHPDLYIRKLWNATEKYSVQIQNRNDLMHTVEWLGEHKKEEAENVKRFIETNDLQNLFHATVPLVNGKLSVDLMEPPPAEMGSILQKMANAFDLAYKRFLDLQKAEAQTREAQIEVAVERVRAKALAMHRSEDLHSVVVALKKELMALRIPDITAATIYLAQDDGSIRILDLSDTGEEDDDDKPQLQLDKVFRLEDTDPDLWVRRMWNRKETYFVLEADEDDFVRVVQWLKTIDPAGAEMAEKIIREKSIKKAWLPTVKLEKGILNIDLLAPPTPEIESILLKMGAGFDLAYKRFLDLQKAEAQAREAQIEAALERVRAKVMAMTNSKDLNATSLVFGEQLRKLGIDWQFSYFWLIEEAKNENTFWITWPDYKTSFTSYTLAEAEKYFNDCLISWRAGVKIHDNYVPPEGVQEWLDTFQRIADDAGGEAKRVMVPQTFPNGVYYYDAMMKYGSFGICISKPATDEEKNIQCRFAIEFERAYTRFLDLKQAEAQARESQIELGLERVRARAMAMQKSDELKELIGTVSTELSKLDLILDRCLIAIFDAKTNSSKWWMSNPEAPSNPMGLSMQYHEMPPYLAYLEAWKTRQLKWQYILEGDTKKEWDEFAFTQTEFSSLPDFVIANMRGNNKVFLNASFNSFGCLAVATLEPLSDEQFDIMLRFAKVFDLTYTRFNDLKQAEAQARESQIELGLERVRARAMAMQKSDELKELIGTVSSELSKLDLILDRCFIMTYDIKTLGVTWWMSNPETSSDPTGLYVKYHEHAPYLAFLKAWQERKVKWQYILEGTVKKTWDAFLFVETELSELPGFVIDNMRANDKVYLSASFNNFGCLTLATLEPLSDEQFDIMLRFAKVFDLTYTRFNDLKQAEAQTRAARIEAALERVRARALAMQEPEELKDVAQVLRTEMGLLGVEELETCSIYINDESAETAECWYALKDIRAEGKQLVTDHFVLNLNETWVGREMLRFYQSPEKQTSIIMQGENRKEWIRYCEEHSAPFRGYYGDVIPDRTYHLYKFSHGSIGAAAAGDISEESWQMLSRAASVFSLAYSRFKDLTQARMDLIKLKEEKKRAEDALTELQVTQKQLIQTEKMASLGELTAGIAHEIQNPLNFVNNFSDVSNELLEEMKSELTTGNTQQAIEIVNNVKENLEKILHHGKRADAIVKSMLQHSRSSTGKKEPTDLNSLTEEYFRLAFHGLRAKDKSFNAKFETDLDKNIGKVNVISQDVGRVILNLINNAFYAVNEKKKHVSAGSAPNGYEPAVTVTTKKIKDKVEIRVKDNGGGIPQQVLDKIFQPFFTTKPTGQGTGLGLSLSYDIITKGHGGELVVKTKEGEGTEFIISLPVN